MSGDIDVSGVPESMVNAVTNLLGELGIHSTGSVQEQDGVWCVFNDWEGRDKRAKAEGTFKNGRFSIGTNFGKWYCCKKQ